MDNYFLYVHEKDQIVNIYLKIVNNPVNSVDNLIDLWKNSEVCE